MIVEILRSTLHTQLETDNQHSTAEQTIKVDCLTVSNCILDRLTDRQTDRQTDRAVNGFNKNYVAARDWTT